MRLEGNSALLPSSVALCNKISQFVITFVALCNIVYLSSDHPFQDYCKVRQVLLQSTKFYYKVRQNVPANVEQRQPLQPG